jgi:glycerol kinase
MTEYIAAIDQGTTSTRCMIFDRAGRVTSRAQEEFEQIYPRPGWVEHDPVEIRDTVRRVTAAALSKADLTAADIRAVGITNQRETTVVWDPETGRPYHNALVWQDTRTDRICADLAVDAGIDRFRAQTGLPIATYFSGPKIRWLLDEVPGLRLAARQGKALFGTIDSWILWNLTGGPDGGLHLTDVTNASRTLLMDLETQDWASEILAALDIPREMLPEIRASSEVYGNARGALAGVPIAGILGDQQAAMFGQACFETGDAKNTYGTGCFLLVNTGAEPVLSRNGLITTVCYRIAGQPAVYALEGSIAIAGALVQWLRDNLGLIDDAAGIEKLASTVADNGGVYFVPAFSGLFAPHWRSEARGVIAGLTRYANRGHFARAALEATAYQTREVLEAMEIDAGIRLASLKVDGGMVFNELLMQFQADILGVPVVRPQVTETTALGAAYAAGLASGYWESQAELRANWGEDKTWQPGMEAGRRAELFGGWKKAVERTLGWVEP